MQNFVPDFDKEKLEFILEIKEAYNRGEISLEKARKKLATKVTSLKPYEIAIAEQELKEFEDDECRKEGIQKMLELFEGFMDSSRPDLPKDHPIECYYRENDELKKICLEIEDLIQYPIIKNQWLELYERLEMWKIHLSRKQNQLYSILEQKGFDRPTTTMWTLDNFIRDEITKAKELLLNDSEAEFIEMQKIIVADIRDLMEKEETILYPTSLTMISDEEFEQMKMGDREIGFAYIDVKEKIREDKIEKPKDDFGKELQNLLQKHGYSANGPFNVAMGSLTLDQINLIYKHMPVDLSYVDENEIVKFYTDTTHRVFPRSKNVIGRDVKNCHPRGSVHLVEEIIEKFRSGEQDTAEFWINKPDLFIYIYYTAVRDEEGNFRGVLEMMQDCTHIRSLEGSQTLLTWANESKDEKIEESKAEIEKPNVENLMNNDLELNKDTKLKLILDRYPWLKDELEDINDAFKMLKTPLARIMIPKATIGMMSEKSGMQVEDLIAKIKEKIKNH
ncbi:MAG: PAS domain-containing protein [Tissierellia bacterium]|nr:PAS domain-containing protein [Tissierellia bacterium]